MKKNRLLLVLGLLFITRNSYGQNNSFNWSDTNFHLYSKRRTQVKWYGDNMSRFFTQYDSINRKAMDTIIHFMKTNQTIKIEIGSHTEHEPGQYTGSIELTQERASEIAAYLTYNGVDSSRIIAKGYGYTKPIIDLAHFDALKTEQERRKAWAINQRIEVTIIAK